MLEFFQFIFSDFWYFIGFTIILGMPLKVIYDIVHKAIRSNTIKKVGYPPAHCDGDGDFKKEDGGEE